MDDRERRPYIHRLIGLGIVVVLVFSILGYNLWHLQIAQGSYFCCQGSGERHEVGETTGHPWRYCRSETVSF